MKICMKCKKLTDEQKLKRDIFWNESLSTYEKNLLMSAGFCTPERLVDVPVVFLCNMHGFSSIYTTDVIDALLKYFDIEDRYDENRDAEYFVHSYADYAELYGYANDNYNIKVLNDFLNTLGYSSVDKGLQITVREVLNINGIDGILLEILIEAIDRAYKKIYEHPEIIFATRNDFKENGNLFFEKLK